VLVSATPDAPEQLLARFGLRSFRPGQREAVLAALQGRDSLVVMPTGAGKSLCYQLPALADERLVLVVSPLIALMDDQRRRLQDAGVGAAMLASTAEPGGNSQALEDIASGAAQVALVAPERFASMGFREALSRREVGLFVVDEAHCVAEWGHDFRPDYLRLRGAIDALGGPTVMATTATATPRVAAEIASRLGLRDWVSVSSGFDRPNLAFDVASFEGKGTLARKRAALEHVLRQADALPAIVYCGTRKDTEELAGEVAGWGVSAVAYHAGLAPQRRADAQRAFMAGEIEVIVATNAFGMGVDKANVRTVAHWALPTSLEAYYQEAGRGGRDGRPGRALLLASRVDLGRLIRFNNDRSTTVEEVRGFVSALRSRGDGDGDRVELGHGELDDRGRQLLSIAERAGAAVLEPGGGGTLLVQLTGRGSSRAAYLAIKAAKDRGWDAYRAIERFAASDTCRRRQILDHFGDEEPCAPSGRCCDVCDPDPQLERAIALASATRPSRARRAQAGAGGGGASSREAAEPVQLSDAEAERFERLRAWRLSRAEGKPAYTVANDRTLVEIVRAMPADVDALAVINGIGPHFCATHADSLLQELSEL
jgi:ATP-dependent DNA helicase RecQ